MELREALAQIADIRRQMAQSAVYRGYRSLTVAASGVLGVAAAVVQPIVAPAPRVDLERYLALWVGVAALCVAAEAAETIYRIRAAGPGLARKLPIMAAEQFLPCLVVGALVTLIIYRAAPQVAWMLPGLWALCFSLGVFASYRLLPREFFWVGAYYVACGVGCLLFGQGDHTLSPWLMGVTFGGGQLLAGGLLYWTLERTSGEEI